MNAPSTETGSAATQVTGHDPEDEPLSSRRLRRWSSAPVVCAVRAHLPGRRPPARRGSGGSRRHHLGRGRTRQAGPRMVSPEPVLGPALHVRRHAPPPDQLDTRTTLIRVSSPLCAVAGSPSPDGDAPTSQPPHPRTLDVGSRVLLVTPGNRPWNDPTLSPRPAALSTPKGIPPLRRGSGLPTLARRGATT